MSRLAFSEHSAQQYTAPFLLFGGMGNAHILQVRFSVSSAIVLFFPSQVVNLTYNYTLFGVSFPIFCRFPRKSGEIAFFCRFLKTPGEISALGTFGVESQSETPTPPLWLEYRGVYPYIKYKKKKKKKKENKIKKKKK